MMVLNKDDFAEPQHNDPPQSENRNLHIWIPFSRGIMVCERCLRRTQASVPSRIGCTPRRPR